VKLLQTAIYDRDSWEIDSLNIINAKAKAIKASEIKLQFKSESSTVTLLIIISEFASRKM
jgi:hypothetical protein